jgi:hypothetical protein
MYLDRCESGDLLFFTTSGAAGCFNRMFMRSEFDHVTMVLKEPGTKRMIMFEIAKRSRCKLYQWSRFVPGDYRIAVRSLITKKKIQ